jgi:hypothetical protein
MKDGGTNKEMNKGLFLSMLKALLHGRESSLRSLKLLEGAIDINRMDFSSLLFLNKEKANSKHARFGGTGS